MDDIDREIQYLTENGCCISDDRHLKRIGEATEMWEKCARCQTIETGEGYGEIPPGKDWPDEEGRCKECDVTKWFLKHGVCKCNEGEKNERKHLS